MYIETPENVTAVYLTTNTFWYQVVPRTFRKDGETWNDKCCEWMPVYVFDYKTPRTNEVRSMRVVSTGITAVQQS